MTIKFYLTNNIFYGNAFDSCSNYLPSMPNIACLASGIRNVQGNKAIFKEVLIECIESDNNGIKVICRSCSLSIYIQIKL